MQLLLHQTLFTLLDLCVSSLRRGHANTIISITTSLTIDYTLKTSRFVRVIIAQNISYTYLAVLFTLPSKHRTMIETCGPRGLVAQNMQIECNAHRL